MDKTVLKRNITDELKEWDEHGTGPLLVYGIKGVGKAFSCREYASAHEGFLYYEPDMTVINGGEGNPPEEYIAAHFGFDTDTLRASFLVINETEKASGFFKKLFETALEHGSKWIFISDHDYLKAETGEINKLQMFPIRFDEFLINLGLSDWYVSSVSENLTRKTKLPDIVHNNLISIFEEYIWTGGMPEVVKEYVNENSLAIRSKQADVKLLALNTVHDLKDESLKGKCRQILDVTEAQLRKTNKKFMFSLIRNGVTYNMYSEAIECLMERGLLLKLEEMSDARKFKMYYPEFSFNGTENFDEISDSEYRLRLENYVLQTLAEKGIPAHFWESGNKAELPFVITLEDNTKVVLDIRYGNGKNSRSVLSYKSKYNEDKVIILADSNLVVTDGSVTLPIYALFCLEKLLKVFV